MENIGYKNDKLISVVIPVFRSEDCIGELVRILTRTLDDYDKSYEIILVNDCSTDHSWSKIMELYETNKAIRGINLRKNFGQDCAIMAGLNNLSGKQIIIMDDDLQHDPAVIPLLLNELEKGCDLCYAFFKVKKQSWFKNFGSWFNGKVAEIIIKKPKNIYLSSFKAIKREVVDEIIKYDGPYPYIDGLLFRITQNITQVLVEHQQRYSGKGNYTLAKSTKVWLRMATNFSIFPLRISVIFGFITSIVGFFLAIYFIIERILVEQPMGWASLIVTLLFLGGIQLVAIGMVGEYIGRLFLYFSKQPQFVISHITERPKK